MKWERQLLNKVNKFSSNSFNKLTGLVFIFILIYIVSSGFQWIFLSANWNVVFKNLPIFAFGSFPVAQQWRPAIWMLYLIALTGLTIFPVKSNKIHQNLPFAWISTIPIGLYLVAGGIGLSPVSSRYWGGLLLTILLTLCSFSLSLPLGIALAIGRQSKLPLIKYLSSIYIDSMRSVPLIAVLFFGQLLIPLFLPIGTEIDRVWRAVFAFTIFVSAYIAEDIRGGLQSIPKTQIEAAESLGLNQIQITQFILIPQALITSLPALTNQAVGLLQNTSLMAILGLVELLGVGSSLLANPEFIGRYLEVYIWLACLYWIVCTIMAILARHLEKKVKFSRNIS